MARMVGFIYTSLRMIAVMLMLVGCPGIARGQDWARQMFSTTSHDFGTVPRGAKTEFEFVLTNKYEEDVHIASVRSSCGCTSPRIAKDTLKTYETGAIIAEFNTRSFIGAKAAVVTVVIDRPYYAEVQLNVRGNIRSDIVTEPGEIQFGEVARGKEKIAEVSISYAGTKSWRITDVRSSNSNLAVRAQRADSGSGQVRYLMQVKLKPTAPAGDFSDEIVLVTNDRQFNLVTVPVRGSVLPPLVMNASVEFGTLRPSSTVQKRLIIKGDSAFEIKQINCEDERIQFSVPGGKKKLHIVPIIFSSGEESGAFRSVIKVETSLSEDGVAQTVARGNVSAN